MNSPNKMFGGMAGSMAGILGGVSNLGAQAPQTGTMTGALGGTTNLGVQPQQGAASVGPQQPPSIFNPNEILASQGIYGGAQAPGTAFRMEGESPLEGNEFSGALAAAKASGEKTFNVNGNTYPVK